MTRHEETYRGHLLHLRESHKFDAVLCEILTNDLSSLPAFHSSPIPSCQQGIVVGPCGLPPGLGERTVGAIQLEKSHVGGGKMMGLGIDVIDVLAFSRL